MKPPKLPPMKMPLPSSHALEAGKQVLSKFAHHAPANVKPIARMERPKGGKGPHN